MYRYSEIGLRTYPYINTRVRVMKSQMIKKEEYDRLIKMSPDEITKFMSDSVYKKEIDELAMKFRGVDLIEAALNLNASRSFNKLIKISSKEVEMLIREYLRRYDIYNLKTILRGKFTNTADEKIKKLFVPAGDLDINALEMLLKKEGCKEIIISSKVVKMNKEIIESINEYEKTKSLSMVENAIDRSYYNTLIELSHKMPKQGKYIREFIKTEIDNMNITILFRLIRENTPKKYIVDKIVFGSEKIKREKLLKLAESKNHNELYEGLVGTGYDIVLENCMDDVNNKNELSSIEIALEKHWLKQAYLMLHQHPLSIGPILGYMVGKDIEIRNLRMLVRAKTVDLDEKFMKDSLVV